MRRYRAVLLDMFDTLVLFNRQHLPQVAVHGQPVHTTSPFVRAVLAPLCPGLSLEAFAEAFLGSYREAEAIRSREHREVVAHDRFRLLFRRLGIPCGPATADLMEAAIREHHRHLTGALEFPGSHRATLDTLAGGYRLGVVSNFDYTPTVEAALRHHGIRERFDTVVVSAEVGWRKPRPEIFARALDALGMSPAEVLFVGDSPETDLLGARNLAMDAVWVNPAGRACPPGIPAPTGTVSGLPELLGLLP